MSVAGPHRLEIVASFVETAFDVYCLVRHGRQQYRPVIPRPKRRTVLFCLKHYSEPLQANARDN